MTYYDRYRYLTTLDAAEDEENWWVAGYLTNGIFRVNKKDNTVHFLKQSESSSAYSQRYRYTFKYREKVYFMPWFSNKVEVYDLKLDKFYVIEIPGDPLKNFCTVGYIAEDEYIYLFSRYCAETPIRINTDTMACERIYDSWKDNVKKYSRDDTYFVYDIAELGAYIWYGVYGSNILLKSSKSNLQDTYEICLEGSYRIERVASVGANRLLISMLNSKECVVYNIVDETIEAEISVEAIGKVVNILSEGDEIVLVPKYGKKLMVVNRDTKDCKIIDCSYEKLRCLDDTEEYFYYGKMDKEKIYLYPYRTNMLLVIDRKDMSIVYKEWEIEEDASIIDIMKKYVIDPSLKSYDERICDLDYWIGSVVKESQKYLKSEDVGSRVHEEIRKIV